MAGFRVDNSNEDDDDDGDGDNDNNNNNGEDSFFMIEFYILCIIV